VTWMQEDAIGMEPVDYSVVADQYVRHRRLHPSVLERLTRSLGPAMHVVEVGCGTGNYIGAIQAKIGCTAVGIDPSPEMLAKLRRRMTSVRVIEGRAEKLELPSSSSDFVFSVDVIHHVQDRAEAYREAFRVLRDGGEVCTVTDSEWTLRHREPHASYFPETVDIELARYPSVEALRGEMTRAGFESLDEQLVEFVYALTDASPYRHRTHSALLYLDEEAFQRGMARLEADLANGPIALPAALLPSSC
jgi:SAM-dependent methyltransferase